MNLEEARLKARALFPSLGPPAECPLVEVGRREGRGQDFFGQLSSMTPPGFPIPGLLLFGLTELLGLADEGPEEKVRWSVRFSVDEATFGFEYRKFGLRMLCEPARLDEPIARQVLGKARALTDIAEGYLSDEYALDQINAGRFTMENLYGRLEQRYRFLRGQAEVAYATAPPPPETGQDEGSTWHFHDTGRPAREGGALGTAAVDAFFSRTEHLFCLAAAFRSAALPPGGILELLSSNWPTKARATLDLADPTAKSFYDKLLDVREEWRNPLAHGGFLSGGGSLHFHIPRVGALPARLRRTPKGVRMGFTLHESSFQELTKLFDAFDHFLKQGELRHAMRWAEANLDVAFDAASRSRYIAACRSDEEFEDFLEWTERDLDRHANMDY